MTANISPTLKIALRPIGQTQFTSTNFLRLQNLHEIKRSSAKKTSPQYYQLWRKLAVSQKCFGGKGAEYASRQRVKAKYYLFFPILRRPRN